jgi:repressor LexA
MTKSVTTTLTARQQQILEWIKDFIRQHRMPPTVREIGAAFGIKSSSVFDQLKALERKGWITREPRKARFLIVRRRKLQRGTKSAGLRRHAEGLR